MINLERDYNRAFKVIDEVDMWDKDLDSIKIR